MPAQGKARSLQIRPIASADLAFANGGVLSSSPSTAAKLGQKVTAFDWTS